MKKTLAELLWDRRKISIELHLGEETGVALVAFENLIKLLEGKTDKTSLLAVSVSNRIIKDIEDSWPKA